MPKNSVKMAFELKTRNDYTKVEAEIGMTVTGNEIPSMTVLGEALELGLQVIQQRVTESYQVPVRV
jgi:hypothetical protein